DDSSSVVPTPETSADETSAEQPEETSTADETTSSTVILSSTVSSEGAEPSSHPSLISCIINGETVDTVDYETGTCNFDLPDHLETFFNFVSTNEYNLQYYYVTANGIKYTTDIRNAGRVLSVPAKVLYNVILNLHEVHLDSSANSGNPLKKRDEADDFINSISDTEGTQLDDYVTATDADGSSLSSSAEPSSAEQSSTEPSSTEPSSTEQSSVEETSAEESTTEPTSDETTADESTADESTADQSSQVTDAPDTTTTDDGENPYTQYPS
ncbi:hypothetical protein G210_2255, partial [Candida maltosa Xu316]